MRYETDRMGRRSHPDGGGTPRPPVDRGHPVDGLVQVGAGRKVGQYPVECVRTAVHRVGSSTIGDGLRMVRNATRPLLV